jgi:hypothetical protein
MSGDVLRRAARLMRERAEAATPGPWYWEPASGDDWPQGDESLRSSGKQITYDYGGPDGSRVVGEYDAFVVSSWGYDAYGTDASDEDRAHIASWHPAVALAVADWLDLEVLIASDPKNHAEISREALAVAHAYLGADQ